MKSLALIAIALVSMVIAQDCSGKTLKSDTTLKIGGRNAIVQFPNGFGSKPAPLLINYHPIMGSAQQWKGGSQIAKVALADDSVVAFMDLLPVEWVKLGMLVHAVLMLMILHSLRT